MLYVVHPLDWIDNISIYFYQIIIINIHAPCCLIYYFIISLQGI